MVAVMRRMPAARALLPSRLLVAAGLLVIAAVAGLLSGCGGGVLSPDLVVVNGGEPSNPLLPTRTIDFVVRLAFTPFYPLPQAAFRDMAAFGGNPIGNGPYRLVDGPDGPAWEHNVKIDMRPNPDYHGNRMPRNKGLRFEFYSNLD